MVELESKGLFDARAISLIDMNEDEGTRFFLVVLGFAGISWRLVAIWHYKCNASVCFFLTARAPKRHPVAERNSQAAAGTGKNVTLK